MLNAGVRRIACTFFYFLDFSSPEERPDPSPETVLVSALREASGPLSSRHDAPGRLHISAQSNVHSIFEAKSGIATSGLCVDRPRAQAPYQRCLQGDVTIFAGDIMTDIDASVMYPQSDISWRRLGRWEGMCGVVGGTIGETSPTSSSFVLTVCWRTSLRQSGAHPRVCNVLNTSGRARRRSNVTSTLHKRSTARFANRRR